MTVTPQISPAAEASALPLWSWELLADGDVDTGQGDAHGSAPAFSYRFDAEHWLGMQANRLRAGNIVSAQLLHRGEPVGQPVSLTPSV